MVAFLSMMRCHGDHLLQMLMDPMGGIVMTNDGNAILREVRMASTAAHSG